MGQSAPPGPARVSDLPPGMWGGHCTPSSLPPPAANYAVTQHTAAARRVPTLSIVWRFHTWHGTVVFAQPLSKNSDRLNNCYFHTIRAGWVLVGRGRDGVFHKNYCTISCNERDKFSCGGVEPNFVPLNSLTISPAHASIVPPNREGM